MAGERAVAGALLLADGLEVDGRRGLEPKAAQRVERGDIGGEAGLHVRSTAAIKPVAIDVRGVGRARPHVDGAGGHDIHVTVEDQRTAGFVPRPVGGDDVDDIVVGDRGGRETGMVAYKIEVDREDLRGIAALARLPREGLLRRVLIAAL